VEVGASHRRGTSEVVRGHPGQAWRCGTTTSARQVEVLTFRAPARSVCEAGRVQTGLPSQQAPQEREIARTYPPTHRLPEPLRRLRAERCVRIGSVADSLPPVALIGPRSPVSAGELHQPLEVPSSRTCPVCGCLLTSARAAASAAPSLVYRPKCPRSGPCGRGGGVSWEASPPLPVLTLATKIMAHHSFRPAVKLLGSGEHPSGNVCPLNCRPRRRRSAANEPR
jgi:hypothetical protein